MYLFLCICIQDYKVILVKISGACRVKKSFSNLFRILGSAELLNSKSHNPKRSLASRVKSYYTRQLSSECGFAIITE